MPATVIVSDKREETKARNRLALIEATIASIADLGFVDTSVTRIIERANLSRGMIHLHFGSKDNLMLAAVKHASEQYYRELERRLPANNASPQQRLETIISADLSDGLLNETSANVWYAFRGEAREQAAFAKYSSTRDKRLKELVLDAFTMIASETDEPDPMMLARDATHGVLALLEGMWMDYLLHTNSFNRGTAKRIVLRFLSAMFPNHFDLRGHI